MELTRRIAAGALAVAVAAVAFFGFAGVAKADYIGVQVGQEKELEVVYSYDYEDSKDLKILSSNEAVASCYLAKDSSLSPFMLKGNSAGTAKVSVSFTDDVLGKCSWKLNVKVSEQPINDCVTLKAGQTARLSNAPYFDDYSCSNESVVSTKPKVATGDVDEGDGFYDVTASGLGFGSATLTYTWDKEWFSGMVEQVSYTVDVVVKDATIAKSRCDFLFTGKTYTAAKLCDQAGLNVSGGKFVKGTGYKVASGGKKVTLTKTGAVNVKYKVGSTTHTIALKAVHSYDALKKAAIAKAKRDSWYPNTFKMISSKQNGVCCEVKFSGENLFGKRVTQTVNACYQFGKVILF